MDLLSGPRRPRWRFMLLDTKDQPLGVLDGVTGGSVEVVALSRLGGSGSLAIDERGQSLDWMNHRVQISYDPGITGVEAWDIATMLFTSPKMVQRDGYRSYDVGLLTKMQVIDQTGFDVEYSIPAGTPIIPAVVAIISSTGETRMSVTSSSAVTTTALRWDAGESKLTIINDLLTACGYWSLWCDGSGQYRVQPYVEPGSRPIVRAFEAGQASIHESTWTREQDHSSVPNKFVVRKDGDDDSPGIVGVAMNIDPASPYSVPSRGGLVIMPPAEVVSDIESKAQADALAMRRLNDAMSPVAKLSVTHAIVPLDPNDLVEFMPRGHTARATVQRMGYQLTFDGQCKAEWREVS